MFQFQKVRLKEKLQEHDEDIETLFQFQKVRLKDFGCF